ncbi:MAG TPA: NAD(P)-dependent oxidoreductase [Egibacteraceae bacterium]|nr:NAD(P)-dependent oxidoreductase [Egibacteraceae bacterium]
MKGGSVRPKIAVAPSGRRDWLGEAILAGGGDLTALGDAEGLVWTDAAPTNDGDGAPDSFDGPAHLRKVLAANPNIRWVQLPWAGVEPFARAGILDHEHLWTCGKGVYAKPVAELSLALALAGLRDLKRFAGARTWEEESGISLIGGRVTIFGGGGVAGELIRLLAPLDVAVTVVRRRPAPMEGTASVVGFDQRFEAIKSADVIFLALALTPDTEGLIGEVEFELMAPHAWLVNVARGEHVLTEDLVIALRENAIGGAALDVTDPEPLPDGHPLWSLPNCIITPHVGNTEEMARPLLSERVTENVRRYAAGEPLIGLVDASLGY